MTDHALEPPPDVPGATNPSFGRLTRASVVFALGSVSGKAIGLVMLPFLTRQLTPDQYGTLDVLSTLASAVISTLCLGFDVATVRLYFDLEPGPRRRLLASYYVMATAAAVTGAVVLALLSQPLSRFLFGSEAEAGAIAIVSLIVVVGTWQVVALNILRAQGLALRYATVTAGGLLLYALATIALMLGWQAVPEAALLGLLVGWGAAAALGLWWVHRSVARSIDPRLVGRVARLGLPLAPALAATFLGDFAYRAILVTTSDSAEVAFLSVALRFASVAGLVVTGYQLAWQPRAYAAITLQRTRGLPREATRIVLVVVSAAVALSLASPLLLVLLAGPAYEASVPIVGWTLAALIGTSLYVVGATRSIAGHRTADLTVATLAGLAIGLAACLSLARSEQAIGTAASMALAQFVAAGMVIFLSRARVPGFRIPTPTWPVAAGGVGLVLLATAVDLPPLVRLGGAAAAIAVALAAAGILPGGRTLRDDA